jgi:hypothetical protein
MFPFSAIASSVKKLKEKKYSRSQGKTPHPIDSVSKKQFFEWQKEGKCGCCGAESGEYVGICDQCRFS